MPLGVPLAFRPLYQSPLVSVKDYACRAGRGGPEAEEHSSTNNIVLLRHGAFSKHFGSRRITADVNQAVYFSRGSCYHISHPAECGDGGTVFEVSPCVLTDIVREIDPSVDEHPDRPFPFVIGPCDTPVFWRHRQFIQRMEAVDTAPLEPLWADETALQLVADVLEAGFARHGLPRWRRRTGTDADHLDRAEAAKTYLASHLAEPVTLDHVARAVYTSPFHLARLFQRTTGVPVHRYLTRLRLRASLERIAGGAKDLTAVALDLGFSSHSHFTDAFRREFGRPPRALRKMSKNLEV